jgi:type II secretory pathway component PulK
MIIDYRKNNATILIITLWVLTLLSAITLSLTYRMGIELKIASNRLAVDKAFYTAKAGVVQAISVLNQDTNNYDALNESWSNYNADLYSVNLFKDVSVGEGKFNISYIYEKDIFSGGSTVFYGMEDEERKININKATQDVLESLPGLTPEIAYSIRAWRGDTDLTSDVLLKEDSYYQSLTKPYKRKGKPFESIEELLLIRDITKDLLYGKDLDGDGYIDSNEAGLVKYLTVYGDGLININTADVMVLRVLGFSEELSYKFIRFRIGSDDIFLSGDDGVFSEAGKIAEYLNYFEPLLPAEQEIINQKQSLLKISSRYYTAHVEGDVLGNKARVSVVIDKESEEGNQIQRWIDE